MGDEITAAQADQYSEHISQLTKTIYRTELGYPIIEYGLLKEVNIVLRDDMDMAGYYSEDLAGGSVIHLNAMCNVATLAAALAHELRHVEHSVHIPALNYYPPLEAVKINRILEADASAYSVGVACEIAWKNGDYGPLEALDNYSEGDIRDAFMANVTPGKPLKEDMAPFRAAYNAWFKKKERVEHYDIEAISLYMDIKESVLSDLFDILSSGARPPELRRIGVMPQGWNYLPYQELAGNFSARINALSGIYATGISKAAAAKIAEAEKLAL
jgi:hypothetical protein